MVNANGAERKSAPRGVNKALWTADMLSDNDIAAVASYKNSNPDPEKRKHPFEPWAELGVRTPEEIKAAKTRSGKAAFGRWAAVGILTGPSKLVVVDLDGAAGEASWLALCKSNPGLANIETWELKTPHGRHLIFGAGNHRFKTCVGKERIWQGIDIRAWGGYEHFYDPSEPERKLVNPNAEIADVPECLVSILSAAGTPSTGPGFKVNPDKFLPGKLRGISPGSHDETLRDTAFALAELGLTDIVAWRAIAETILSVSDEGTDGEGRVREPFTQEKIDGFFTSAMAGPDDVPAFTVRPMSDTFEEVSEEIGPDGIAPVSGITNIIGESNVGKSPLSYWILLQRVRAGQKVGIYESEMGAYRIQKKLRQLGATDEELGQILNYGDWGVRDRDLLPAARKLAGQAIADGIGTFLFDSLISMLAASRIAENDSTRVREWSNKVAGSMAASGISVLVIDHTGHGDKERGRGSSDKKPACDFAFVMIEVIAGRVGISGAYRLKCIKDRSATVIGDEMQLKLAAEEDGQFTYQPEGWSADLAAIGKAVAKTAQDPITDAMKASEVTPGRGLTPTAISKATGLSIDATRSALRRGQTASFVQVGDGTWTLRGLPGGLPGGRGPQRGRGRSHPLGGTARPRGRPRRRPQATEERE